MALGTKHPASPVPLIFKKLSGCNIAAYPDEDEIAPWRGIHRAPGVFKISAPRKLPPPVAKNN